MDMSWRVSSNGPEGVSHLNMPNTRTNAGQSQSSINTTTTPPGRWSGLTAEQRESQMYDIDLQVSAAATVSPKFVMTIFDPQDDRTSGLTLNR